MAQAFEQTVRDMFHALDRGDRDTLASAFTKDAIALDELSRAWLIGRDQLVAHLDKILSMASDIRSDLQDVRTVTWGDTGMVVGRLEQDYTIEGKRTHISAPTTVVLRDEGGQWRIVHFHSAPLPDA